MDETKLRKNSSFLIGGGSIIAFSLGSIFFRELIQVSFWLLIVLAFSVIISFNKLTSYWKAKKKADTTVLVYSFISLIIMMLFLGIQSPQMIGKQWLLGFGIVVVFIGLLKK